MYKRYAICVLRSMFYVVHGLMLQCQQLVLHLQWQRLILVFGRELYSSDNGAAFDATMA